MVIERHGLAMDPSLSSAAKSVGEGEGEGAPADPLAGMQQLHAVKFEPWMVGSYCHGAVNAVHTDPVVAVEFGYAAPIWAGTGRWAQTLKPLSRRPVYSISSSLYKVYKAV